MQQSPDWPRPGSAWQTPGMTGVAAKDGRSRLPHRDGPERASGDASRGIGPALLVALLVLTSAAPAAAQDPSQTATIYIGGFNNSGADGHGVFGLERHEALLDSIAALV